MWCEENNDFFRTEIQIKSGLEHVKRPLDSLFRTKKDAPRSVKNEKMTYP